MSRHNGFVRELVQLLSKFHAREIPRPKQDNENFADIRIVQGRKVTEIDVTYASDSCVKAFSEKLKKHKKKNVIIIPVVISNDGYIYEPSAKLLQDNFNISIRSLASAAMYHLATAQATAHQLYTERTVGDGDQRAAASQLCNDIRVAAEISAGLREPSGRSNHPTQLRATGNRASAPEV